MPVKTLLVAEDEKPLATALKLKLTKEGYTVLVAHDGKTALSYIQNKKVDLALLDLMMPEMNGFEILEALQKMKNMPQVLVLSNLSQEEDITRVKQLGAIEYFVKSDTPIKDIVAYVKKLLNEPTG